MSNETLQFIGKLYNTVRLGLCSIHWSQPSDSASSCCCPQERQHFDTVKDLLRLRLQVQVAQRVDVDLKEHCKQATLKFESEQAAVLQQYNADSAVCAAVAFPACCFHE
jgi:hypothetical protein